MKFYINQNRTFGLIEVSVDKNSNLNFIITDKKIVFSISALSHLLKVLLFAGFISPKILEGVLEEYNTYKQEVYDGKN